MATNVKRTLFPPDVSNPMPDLTLGDPVLDESTTSDRFAQFVEQFSEMEENNSFDNPTDRAFAYRTVIEYSLESGQLEQAKERLAEASKKNVWTPVVANGWT